MEKKIKGRKRQIVVDSEGLLHQVLVHKANVHDSKGGSVLADIALKQHKQVKMMLADLGYRWAFEDIVQYIHKRKVQFSPKIKGEFVIQPKRWVVERTFADQLLLKRLDGVQTDRIAEYRPVISRIGALGRQNCIHRKWVVF